MMKPRKYFLMAVVWAVFCYRYVAANYEKTYLVYMDKSVMPSSFSDHVKWYEATMRSVSTTKKLSSTGSGILYAYDKVMHGFSASLTADEARLLKKQQGIVSVEEEPVYQLQTTQTPTFLGIENMQWTLPESINGGNVIVGVVDTGVWPGRSLDDTGFGPIPSKWKGICQTGTDFPASACNRKLIGARYFLASYEAQLAQEGKRFDENAETRSPVDDNGHGTHCATIAIGSAVRDASFFGYATGTAHGMAPHARLAVYKACWEKKCLAADILAAFEAAITDGVDILSLSLGVGPSVVDPVAVGGYKAVSQGIFVAFAAGNSGPTPLTVDNVSPWVITVGASSLDRDFPAYVTLGNGMQFYGQSLWTSDIPFPEDTMLPVVLASTINLPNSSLCYPGSLQPATVAGKIVVCEIGEIDGMTKSLAVREAGGVGMILANTGYIYKVLDVELVLIPTSVVDHAAYSAIRSYVLSNPQNAMAKLTFQGTLIPVQPSPIVAKFSSRGPNSITPYILKPDIIAPGVNILAAWTPRASPNQEFNIMSGTSMACPHISGLAVVLKITYPDWSPAAIRSALMTTAYTRYESGKEDLLDVATGCPATPFDIGAGHVNPISALNPGLVYDASTQDYLNFLCALNYPLDIIRRFSATFTCVPGNTYRVEDLNYPSFVVPFRLDPAQTVLKYTRTLTNVGPAQTYRVFADVNTPHVVIQVEPGVLTFRENEKKTYTVTFTANCMPRGTVSSGYLVWFSDTYNVRSSIAFTWT